MWLPWSNAAGQLMCTPFEYALPPCLYDGMGLLPWEWQHFQEQQAGRREAEGVRPDQHVLHAVHAEQASQPPSMQHGFNLTHYMVSLKSTEALQAAEGLHEEPIILLNNLVHLDLASQQHLQAFGVLEQHCSVVNTTKILSKFDTEHWNLADIPSDATADHAAAAHVEAAAHAQLHVTARLRRGKLHRHAASHLQATVDKN